MKTYQLNFFARNLDEIGGPSREFSVAVQANDIGPAWVSLKSDYKDIRPGHWSIIPTPAQVRRTKSLMRGL